MGFFPADVRKDQSGGVDFNFLCVSTIHSVLFHSCIELYHLVHAIVYNMICVCSCLFNLHTPKCPNLWRIPLKSAAIFHILSVAVIMASHERPLINVTVQVSKHCEHLIARLLAYNISNFNTNCVKNNNGLTRIISFNSKHQIIKYFIPSFRLPSLPQFYSETLHGLTLRLRYFIRSQLSEPFKWNDRTNTDYIHCTYLRQKSHKKKLQ